jgi:hypothetical protein
MNDKTVTLVRQLIFTVLDEREWNFENDEQRVDFADRVASFIPSDSVPNHRQMLISADDS